MKNQFQQSLKLGERNYLDSLRMKDEYDPLKMFINPRVICENHQQPCTLHCHYPYCSQRVLCKLCLSDHPTAHLSYVKQFRDETILSDRLLRQVVQWKTSLANVYSGLQRKKEQQFLEIEEIIKQLNKIVWEQFAIYKDKLMKRVEQFYEQFQPRLSEQLYQLNLEQKRLQFYSNPQNKVFSNKDLSSFLEYQRELNDKVFPEFEIKTNLLLDEFRSELLGSEQKTKYLNLVEQELQKLFNTKFLMKPMEHYKIQAEMRTLPRVDKFENRFMTPDRNRTALKQLSSSEAMLTKSLPFPIENWNYNRVGSSEFNTLRKLREMTKNAKHSFARFDNFHLVGSHTDIICCMTALEDRFKFATAGGDWKIKCWDINEGKVFALLEGHQNDIWDLSYISLKQLLLSASADKSIKV